ncbi:hypothetical protein KR222_003489 [Zaprionus bogoriensis]|nr:hypothetical protein KR222_003489 [Zaprionus bogoriensis]
MEILKFRRKRKLFLLIVLTVLFMVLCHKREWGGLNSMISRKQRARRIIAPDRSSDIIRKYQRKRDIKQLVLCQNSLLKYKDYYVNLVRVIENIVIGTRSEHMGCGESITYTTYGDYTSLGNLETVAKRWQAPISFALFTTEADLYDTLDAIQYVRNCLPDSRVIREFVSFHLYFSMHSMPESMPNFLQWTVRCVARNGTRLTPPFLFPRHKVVSHNVSLPISMGHNFARRAANTHFILACDIEFSPSVGFVDMFLDMVHRNNSVLSAKPWKEHRVYVLPAFQINDKEPLPGNKLELMELYNSLRAHLFYTKNCPSCNIVPDYLNWLNWMENVTGEMSLMRKTRHEGHLKDWEPFYVSDNLEPLYDDRVIGYDQYIRKLQNFAMCLMGYEYYLLHPAFLLHSPGTRKMNPKYSGHKPDKKLKELLNYKIGPAYLAQYGGKQECILALKTKITEDEEVSK